MRTADVRIANLAAVLAAVKASGTTTVAALCVATGLSDRTVQARLRELLASGDVVVQSKGVYAFVKKKRQRKDSTRHV